MQAIAGWIADIIAEIDSEQQIANVREQVEELCARFPVYTD